MTLEEAMKALPPIWVIYDHPEDVPGAIVVRCWYGEVRHPDAFLTQSLDAAREYCWQQGGSFCLLRHSYDDPKIVESWI